MRSVDLWLKMRCIIIGEKMFSKLEIEALLDKVIIGLIVAVLITLAVKGH